MSSNRLCSVIATGAVLAATLGVTQLAAAPAQAAAATCHGHRATIVAHVGQKVIRGTNHRDVIVGNHQQNEIHARGGDDIVCGGDNSDRIYGGPGDDHLFGQGAGDVVMGGSGDDHVFPGPATKSNIMNGGLGDDVLVSVDPDDSLWFTPFDPDQGAPPVRVDLEKGTATGQGHDVIRLADHPTPHVIVPSGSVARGTPYVDDLEGSGSVFFGGKGDDLFYTAGSVVHGGPGDDDFVLSATTHKYPKMSLFGGAGDDRFEDTTLTLDSQVTVDGGSGTDTALLYLFPTDPAQAVASLTLDLAAGSLTAPGVSMPVRDIESVSISLNTDIADAFTLDGTDQGNRLIAMGDMPTTVDGRGDDDFIVTGDGADTVQGGAGDDTADTGEGQDSCSSVEHATNCETLNP